MEQESERGDWIDALKKIISVRRGADLGHKESKECDRKVDKTSEELLGGGMRCTGS